MQPTELQVQRSLEALRGSGRSGDAMTVPAEMAVEAAVPTEAMARLEEAPAVRTERIEEAKQRLAAGELPTDEALAQRMVGRLVCDRLR